MPDFRTPLPSPSFPFRISHRDGLLCLGSCFAEHIGGRLQQFKFPAKVNPFGIQYHPLAIAQGLQRLQAGAFYQAEDLFEHQGLWRSFDHHSRLAHPEQDKALALINHSLAEGRAMLQRTTRLLLTFGTAHVFTRRENGRVVTNCHQLPGELFSRRRLDVKEIVIALQPILELIQKEQPDLQVLLTVSPVRHLRDGFIDNQRSKATLLLAAAELEDRLPFVHYFPAYELLMDDLRDYRFYAADRIHPSPEAVDYIWNYFAEAFFDRATGQLIERIERLQTAANHRSFHPDSDAHQTFLRRQLEKLQELQRTHPDLNMEKEEKLFQIQLRKKP